MEFRIFCTKSAIAGHGRPVKPALSHDGELRAVASKEETFLRISENPFDGTDSVEPFLHALPPAAKPSVRAISHGNARLLQFACGKA
ncbi:MAG: hypothetical protein NC355_07490 [Blautia sp.]|nr:hypothetical protein [Blautia sp.]